MSLASTTQYSLPNNFGTLTPKPRRKERFTVPGYSKVDTIDTAHTWRRGSNEPIKKQGTTRARCSKLAAGDIVFLPSQDQIKKDSIVHGWESHAETYGHPVLVVKIISEEIVEIKTVTSLGNTPLGEKGNYRNEPLTLSAHLLIEHPNNQDGRWNNPNGSRVLDIKDGKKLASPCYLRLDKRLQIETSELRESDPSGIRLDEESTRFVQRQELVQLYDSPRTRPCEVTNMVLSDDLAELRIRSSTSQELRGKRHSLPKSFAPTSSSESLASNASEPTTSSATLIAAPAAMRRAASDTFLGLTMSFADRAKAKREADKAKSDDKS